MKKIYSILFAAAVLIAAASCTKNEINPDENDNTPVKVNINVASFGPDTKALKSGTLRGFWEASNNCMSWEKASYSFDFPGKDKKSTTGQIQYIVADFSSVSYTFAGSTLTASITTWNFRANIQCSDRDIIHTRAIHFVFRMD